MRSLLVLISMFDLVMTAQSQKRVRTSLEANTLKMEVELKMDRNVYLPGEDASIEISVHNPTSELLEIAEPFRSSPLVLMKLSELSEGVDWNTPGIQPKGFVSHPPGAGQAVPFMIEPGATLKHRKRVYSRECNTSPWMAPCFMPTQSGTYGWVYGYGKGTRVKFSVESPELVEFAETRLRTPGPSQPRFEPNSRKPETPFLPQLYTRAVIVQTKEGARFVLVGRRMGGFSNEYPMTGRFEGEMVGALMAPVFRLVEGDRSLEALKIAESDENDVCLVQVSQKGESKAMRVDAIKGEAVSK